MNSVTEPLVRLAARVDAIQPFYVMELAKEAALLERDGRDIIHMGIGEPDFTAPEPVIEAAASALRRGVTQYTNALGLHALREAISAHYAGFYGVSVDPARIVVTAGASAALLLACAALVDRDDEVLMPDPCYPCNRHFVIAAEGKPVMVPSGPAERFQLTAADVELLTLADQLLHELGIADGVTLQLNTLGDAETRDAWRAALVAHFEAHRGELSDDSRLRISASE